MTTDHREGPFICPECGSLEGGVHMLVEPIHNPTDPWTSVLQIDICAACGSEIPVHLAERWDGVSIEDARREWREIYKDA